MKRLFLLTLLALFIRSAQAQNATTVGAFDVKATFESVGVKASFTGDANANNTALLEYKLSSSGTWLAAYPVIIDRRATIVSVANPHVSQARGSVVGLTANTSYDVRLTWTDADGVTGGPTVSDTITTVTLSPPLGGTTYYVATAADTPAGSNSNNGSSGAPWLTIAHAITNSVAGDTIRVRTGTFAGLTISSSGTAGAYRKLMPDTAATVTISATATDSIIVDANYWYITGLTFAASVESSVRVATTRHHVYITSCTAADVGTGHVFNSGFVSIRQDCFDIYVLSNTITRTTAGTDNVHGVNLTSTGTYNIVVADNSISGIFRDGIGNGSNSSLESQENSDFARNTFTNWEDDSIELDGGSVNLRVWGNIGTSNTAQSIISPEARVGPAYVFRNDLQCTAGASGLKQGNGGVGYTFIFHNTFRNVGAEAVGEAGGTPHSELHTYRNNIFVGNDGYSQQGRTNSYNYNLISSAVGSQFVANWNETTTDYLTLAAFQAATSQELNGISANPNLINDTTDHHLQSNSPAINAGVSLANFNGTNSAWTVYGAAPDMGAYEYVQSEVTTGNTGRRRMRR